MSPGPERTASGVGLVLVGVLSVQLGAGLAASLFPLAGPGGAVSLRLAIAALLLGLVWPRLPPLWTAAGRASWRRGFGWPPAAWRAVAAFGAVLAVMNWTFYEALARIPLGIAVAVEFAGPLTLSLALSRRALDVAWALGAAAGLAALTLAAPGTGEEPLDPAGVALAAVAGTMWALYILLSRRVGSLVPGTRPLVASSVVAALLTLPLGLAAGPRLLDPRVLALGAGVALLSSALAYAVEMEALRRIPARLFGVLLSLEPAVAALVGVAVLGQLLSAPRWLGIAGVCAASVGATLTARRRPAGPG